MCWSRWIPPSNQVQVKKWFLRHLYFFSIRPKEWNWEILIQQLPFLRCALVGCNGGARFRLMPTCSHWHGENMQNIPKKKIDYFHVFLWKCRKKLLPYLKVRQFSLQAILGPLLLSAFILGCVFLPVFLMCPMFSRSRVSFEFSVLVPFHLMVLFL